VLIVFLLSHNLYRVVYSLTTIASRPFHKSQLHSLTLRTCVFNLPFLSSLLPPILSRSVRLLLHVFDLPIQTPLFFCNNKVPYNLPSRRIDGSSLGEERIVALPLPSTTRFVKFTTGKVRGSFGALGKSTKSHCSSSSSFSLPKSYPQC